MKKLCFLILTSILLLSTSCIKKGEKDTFTGHDNIDNTENNIIEVSSTESSDTNRISTNSMHNPAIIITDEINVVTLPSIDGRVKSKKKFGDIIQIFDEKGSGIFDLESRILDLWYKIDKDNDEWVNAFYVRKFPFCIACDDYYAGQDINRRTFYSSNVAIGIHEAFLENDVWYLKMDVHTSNRGVMPGEGGSRIEKILETYNFYGTEVRLIDNSFNNLIELSKVMINKIENLTGTVAWTWYYMDTVYEGYEYDFSGIELKYDIGIGKPISYVKELLGDRYYTEYYGAGKVYIYSQWFLQDSYTKVYYYSFKIKFYTNENDEIIKIAFEEPLVK